MNRNHIIRLLTLLIVVSTLAPIGHPLSAETFSRVLEVEASEMPVEARTRTPIALAEGQVLRVEVRAVAGDSSSEDLIVAIEVKDADGGRALAQLRPSRVRQGRSVHLEYRLDEAESEKRVVVHLDVEGGANLVATAAVSEGVNNQNQLWGDWFIV